jgi:hypothetical protein
VSSVLEKRFSLGALFRHNIRLRRRIEHVGLSSISYVSFSLGRLTLFAAFLVLLLGGRDIAFISLSNDFFESERKASLVMSDAFRFS